MNEACTRLTSDLLTTGVMTLFCSCFTKLKCFGLTKGNRCFSTSVMLCLIWSSDWPVPSSVNPLKSFCLREWGRLGNEGRPILLKIGTHTYCEDLCNIPKFQLH